MTDPIGDPLFLTGFPKSGTTLLLSLLDGHSALNVFPKETLFFPYALADLEADREQGIELFVERIFEGVLFGLEEVIADEVGTDRYKVALKERWAETGYSLPRFLDIAVETYGELIGRSRRRFWVEKTPQTELDVPTLREWYPTMRAIHCIRDPRANYAAIRTWNERELGRSEAKCDARSPNHPQIRRSRGTYGKQHARSLWLSRDRVRRRAA